MWSDEKVLLIEKPKKEGEIFEDEYLLLFNFQGLFGPHRRHGGVAQLGEHLPCKQGVMGSNPIISTKSVKRTKKKEAEENGSGREAYGLIAQVVRARA